jgi:hypothetical protein
MPWIIGGAMLGSAVLGGVASGSAARAQERAAREGAAAEERMYNKSVELQEPFRQAGVNALPELVAASRYTPFRMEQFQADPGYAFRLQEGIKALDRSAAARGGLLSGNQLRGITEFGQNLGSQEFGNAFNRYQLERQARLGPLQSLTGMGQTTANTLTGLAGTYGQNMAQNAAQTGNIRASGYMNTANALTGALGQGLNYYQNQQLMNRFFPQQQQPTATTPSYGSPYDLNTQNFG